MCVHACMYMYFETHATNEDLLNVCVCMYASCTFTHAKMYSSRLSSTLTSRPMLRTRTCSTCVCMYVCMYVCIIYCDTCKHVLMQLYLRMYMYIYIYTHTHIHTHTRTYTHTHIHTHSAPQTLPLPCSPPRYLTQFFQNSLCVYMYLCIIVFIQGNFPKIFEMYMCKYACMHVFIKLD
jgi:hypothetical protein